MSDLEITKVAYPNHKRINWESYQEELKINRRAVTRIVHLVQYVELAADLMQQAVLSSHH